jgi:hypothetical protein
MIKTKNLMKRSDKIFFLLKNPVKTITSSLFAMKEEIFMEKVKKKYGLARLPTIDLLTLFPGFSETLNYYTFLEGTSLVTDLMLLKSLARQYTDCSYLEIGTWRGESIANISEVSAECIAITLPEEEMKLPEDKYKISGFFSRDKTNIKTIKKNSFKFDFNTLDKKFDLIFIDGDHSYEGVLNDTVKTFSLRKNNSSVIVWHDYGFSTEKVRHSVLSAILDGIPRELHGNLYHISNTLCAVYIENINLETSMTDFPSFPENNFRISVTAERTRNKMTSE